MRPIEYLDFELDIGPAANGVYPLAVIRSPAGEDRATLRLPFDVAALGAQLPALTETLLQPRDFVLPDQPALQPDLPPVAQSAELLGQALFAALLPDGLNNLYDLSLQEAARQGKGLRIKLRIEPPELALLPWEYLYDRRHGEYVCLSRATPLVRYIEQPQPIAPLLVTLPLRILGVVASPSDLGQLDVAHEQRRLEQAVAGLRAAQQVELVWLENPTWRDLQQRIWQGDWHIFHFIGHGSFDAEAGGTIALSNEAGTADLLSARELARLLGDHQPLRLALLNACQGARGNAFNLFASTAASLVQRGTPAVVAMQYPITDAAAIEFARTFYAALADAIPIDAAVAEARKAISFASASSSEWAVPVLFMRSPDGVIFTRPESSTPHVAPIDALLTELAEAQTQGDLDRRIELGRQVLALDPQQQRAHAAVLAALTTRGQRRYRAHAVSAALADFDAALALDPQAAVLGYWRGLCYEQQGDQARAREAVTLAAQQLAAALEHAPQQAEHALGLGLCLLWQEQYLQAIERLSQAITLGATTAECYTARGRAYEASGSHEQAIVDLTRAIELDPQYVEAYSARSDSFNHLGRYQSAVADLTQAIQLDPDNGEFYVARASSFYNLGDYERAINDLSRALEQDASDAQVYYLRGTSYHQAVFHEQPIGDYERAIADFSQAIALDPQPTEYYVARASSAYQLALRRATPELLASAVADFSAAIERVPSSGEYFYGRGLVRKLQRDLDAAQRDFKQAVELGYERARAELGWWQRLFE